MEQIYKNKTLFTMTGAGYIINWLLEKLHFLKVNKKVII